MNRHDVLHLAILLEAPQIYKNMQYGPPLSHTSVAHHDILSHDQNSSESTEYYLISLTHGFANAINARDWAFDGNNVIATHVPGRWSAQPDNIWQHVDASYVVEYEHMACANTLADCESPTLDLREQILHVKKACEDFPDFRVEFGDMRCEIDDRKGRATVFADLTTWGWCCGLREVGEMRLMCSVGMPAGIVRQSVIAYDWRRTHGVWTCVRNRGLRGINMC